MIRDAEPGDAPFVRRNFLDSYRGSPWAGPIPSEIFDEVALRSFVLALSRPGMRRIVASVLLDGRELLLGFAVGRAPDTLVYAYVKRDYRRGGILSSMLAELGIDRTRRIRCAYWSEDWKRIVRSSKLLCDYRPDIVRRAPRREHASIRDIAPAPEHD